MAQTPRLVVVDVLRGVTILWVTLLHFYVDTRGVPGRDTGPQAAVDAFGRGDLLEGLAVALRSLVGLPGFRLDVLLFVTGLVLCLARPTSALDFLRRRARSILPSYWLGSLAAAALLIVLAALRSWGHLTPFSYELHEGTILGRTPYRFEWLDLLRSLSVVGRLEDPRTMQVVAPSLWYLMLVAQLYLVFPWLRRMLDRLGPVWFLIVCGGATVVGRALVFEHPPLEAFDANATVICFLPFRLISPALGMVAASWLGRVAEPPRPLVTAVALVPALVAVVAATWLGIGMNRPGTLAGVLGPVLPLALALPGLWLLALATLHVPHVAGWLTWSGRRSLSLLVVQDFLRLGVGTALVFGARLPGVAWWVAAPVYLGVALLLARWWEPLQGATAARLWPESPRVRFERQPSARPEARDEAVA